MPHNVWRRHQRCQPHHAATTTHALPQLPRHQHPARPGAVPVATATPVPTPTPPGTPPAAALYLRLHYVIAVADFDCGHPLPQRRRTQPSLPSPPNVDKKWRRQTHSNTTTAARALDPRP